MENMENIANRFWMYLLEKKKKVITKEDARISYDNFQKIWDRKEEDFTRVFDSLRKSRLKYIFNKKWYILSKEEFEDLKNNRFDEHEIIFRFLDNQKIQYYLGLSSAKYFNKLNWQSLKIIYVINSKIKLKRKIGNVEIRMIKFPKGLIVNLALIKSDKRIFYSDIEKTFLDEIYYYIYKKGKLQILGYDLDKLNIEKIKAYLAFYSKYDLVKKEVDKILNKKQLKQIR